MLITDEYVKLNKELHNLREDFGSNGHKWAQVVVDLCKQLSTRDVLDYGCGKGTLRTRVPLIDVKNYDPAMPQWSERPKPADIVCCLDVLEHIEPELLDNVLKDLASLAKRCLILVVATREAKKFLPDGRNAHLTQEGYQWWFNKLDLIGFRLQQLNNADDLEFLAIYQNKVWSPEKDMEMRL